MMMPGMLESMLEQRVGLQDAAMALLVLLLLAGLLAWAMIWLDDCSTGASARPRDVGRQWCRFWVEVAAEFLAGFAAAPLMLWRSARAKAKALGGDRRER